MNTDINLRYDLERSFFVDLQSIMKDFPLALLQATNH